MPKVSIIIPVYGVEKYIEKCARSLFEQTLDDIEFLFIDDCTQDRSINVLKRVLEDYPHRQDQVKIHKMERNSGQAAVREWGILNASGDYIINCDSDDWVTHDMYHQMYEKAIEDNADIVVCDYNISNGESVLRRIKGCESTDKVTMIKRLLLQRDPWSLCNKLFKRTVCTKDLIFPKGNMGEDMVLTTQMLLNGGKVAYIARPLYNYFLNQESITHQACEEKKMSNFWQNKENADIVYGLILAKDQRKQYFDAIVSNKWYIKKMLWNTAFDRPKRQLWKSVYEEINTKVMISNYISFKDKIRFVLTYLCLFPDQTKSR